MFTAGNVRLAPTCFVYAHLMVAIPEAKLEIEQLTDHTNEQAQRVRQQLKKLDGDLKGAIEGNPDVAMQSDYKIRRNMHATLTKKFMDQMETYQACQTKHKGKAEAQIKRQFKIVKPDATQAEVDAVLEGGGQGIFTENMLASQNARSALEDVQEKHKDIQRLESSIQELHQLFVDLSVLVLALPAVITSWLSLATDMTCA